MLILLKGKARKSEYFSMLHNGCPNSQLIQFGQDVHSLDGITVPRKYSTITDMLELEKELNDILSNFLSTNIRTLFLYCNFTNEEVEVLRNLIEDNNSLPDIFVSVQDDTVPNGQLVIEEIRI